MKINFCTYFDINYLSKFLTLKNSLNKFNFEYTFYILALDNLVVEFTNGVLSQLFLVVID